VADSSVHTWQSIVDGSLPLPFLQTPKKRTIARCLSFVQTSSGAVILTACSLGTNGLQLNHTHSMLPSDLELQHDQVSAVLLIIQRKYFIIAFTFLISYIRAVQLAALWSIICGSPRRVDVFQFFYKECFWIYIIMFGSRTTSKCSTYHSLKTAEID
jgi:hypothetical protein